MSKPTILFVPGAFHHPASFHLVTSSLKDLGYPIAAVDHPSNNKSDKGLVDDIANVRSTPDNLIKTEKKAVVLVLHSYGGLAGGAGMHGYEQKERERNDEDGGIVAVLYIAALAGPKCTSLLKASGGKFASWINIDGPTCTVTDPHKVFYSDMSLEAAQPYIDQLTPICLQAFEQGCPADCYSRF